MRIKLDIPFCLDEIAKILGAPIPSSYSPQAPIEFISTNSRECRKNDLFIALSGENGSGEKYVSEAIEKECYVISALENRCIRVDDTAEALIKISKAYKVKVEPKFTVAVTGSVGKSTTVKFISAILKERYSVHSTPGNFNNHIGVPITLLTMPKNTSVLITELGMNHKGEISKLSKAVNPDVAVITSVGTAHIGNLGSREAIAAAKLEILDGMRSNTKNLLLPSSEKLLANIDAALYVGRNSSLSDYSLNNYGTEAYSFVFGDRSIDGIRFFDKREHLLYDLALAISVAVMLGLCEDEILKGVSAITDVNLRQRFIELYDYTIFEDAYNASLESVSADLKYISSFNRPSGAFLGDVLELGDDAERIHEEIGAVAATLKIDRLYLFGEYAEHIARGALSNGMDSESIYINSDLSSPHISIDHIKENHLPNEIILFKASHKLRFDKIADMIKNEEGICDDTH